MAFCKTCSAPLAANTTVCRYCSVRNDVDLQGNTDFSVKVQQSMRLCPVCHSSLQTIELKASSVFYIERCHDCFGLFFEPGEIDAILESTIPEVFTINRALIENINKDRFPADKKFSYVKCPVCQMLMNRVCYGYLSGVVVDRCIKHGIWLDSSEFVHLLEWKKAGGELLARQQSSTVSKTTDYGHVSSETEESDLIKSLSFLLSTF
jgi:Zn-finger nucleic acid-binding protein